MELLLFRDPAVICCYEIPYIASKGGNPGLRLCWQYVHVQSLGRSWENGYVVRPLFSAKILKCGFDSLRCRKIKRSVFSWWVSFPDCELLQSCALNPFVLHDESIALVIKMAKSDGPA